MAPGLLPRNTKEVRLLRALPNVSDLDYTRSIDPQNSLGHSQCSILRLREAFFKRPPFYEAIDLRIGLRQIAWWQKQRALNYFVSQDIQL